jgi:hypothetical protein
MKTILFGGETQSLIAVLTFYAAFHAFYTTTWTSFPSTKETIYSILYLISGIHLWNLSAEV